MTQSIPLPPLYPHENAAEFESIVANLITAYSPVVQREWDCLAELADATWLKQRYSLVRSHLYEQLASLPVGDTRRSALERSIERFQKEVDQQKDRLASLRRGWRLLKQQEAAEGKDADHALVPAA